MALKELVAPTLKELFIEELEKKIISGEWPIGMKLPSERDMEKEMKVSRTIINTGLKVLSDKGFVDIHPRVGVYVNDYIKYGNFNTLLSIMNYNGGKLNKETLTSLLNFRYQTDCDCASLAATNRNDIDLIELKQNYELLKKEKDHYKVSKLKLEFEHSLYISTHNTIYPLLCNSFLQINKTLTEKIFETYGIKDATYKFDELINAIENKDANGARLYMSEIMNLRIKQLKEIYLK